jgi:hypothetical protein
VRSLVLLCLLALLAGASPSHATGRRVALVIGVNAYKELPKLAKATGDANALAATLGAANFTVTKVLDPDRRALNKAIALFANSLGPDDVALVHFSGHGVEIEGENFLLPADAPMPAEGGAGLVKSEALAMSGLIQQISEKGARVRIFIIDACRDNPFAKPGSRSVGSSRGLARVDAPAGTFIMYSAGYKQQALDTLGPRDATSESVYTRVLLKHLTQPGQKLQDVALSVRSEVEQMAKSVGHEQRPAYYDELSAGFALTGEQSSEPVSVPVQIQETPQPQPQPQPQPRAEPPVDTSAVEIAYWNSIKDSASPEPFQAYLRKYPNGQFTDLAGIKLRELVSSRSTVDRPPRADPPLRTVSYHYLVGLDPRGDNFLALKEFPAINAPRLRKMGPETLLEVLDRNGPWLKVRTQDGTTGWAHGKYIACCKTVAR